MSFEFQSTLVNITPNFRISGSQIGGVRIEENGGIRVARIIVTNDADIKFALTGPYESGDPDVIYTNLSAELYEAADGVLLNEGAISSIERTTEVIVIDLKGSDRKFAFMPSADVVAPVEVSDHTWKITEAGFNALTAAATLWRSSMDGTLEGLADSVAQEAADRLAADTAIQADVDQNEADADAAIAAEATTRETNDNTIIASVDAEATSREAADTALSGRLDVLEADPTTATAVAAGDSATLSSANSYTDTAVAGVQADVDQNESDSDAADAALSGRLDVLEADPTTATAVAAVQADVDQNESDGDAADAALSARLDVLEADPTTATALAAVQSDVDQNEADSDAAIAGEATTRANADTALSGRLDVLEADPTTATAVAAVQSDVDQNESDSDAADAALSARLDVLEADPATATAVAANTSDIADIRSVTGTLDGSTHLGNFSGAIITDGIAIKTALQELSNAIEATQTDVDGNEADADTADALRALLDGSNIPGPYANDAAAASGGVAVGAIYKHDNGQIHYRVS